MAGVARFVASSLAPAAQRFAPQAAAGVLRQILEVAIDGYQRFPGAERVAESKLARVGGRADQMAKDPRPDREKVEELFVWAFGRRPTANQMRLSLENIALHANNKRIAYENILWALLNTKEFVFNK